MEKRSKRITHADRVMCCLTLQNRPLSAYDILEGSRADGVAAATTVTEHIDADSIAGLSERTAFAPNHSVLEIHGRCNDCDTAVPAH